MHFLLVVLAAVPVHVETLGFTVESDGEVVKVIDVAAGGSAEKAGVTPGVVIDFVQQPTYLFARGKLASLPPQTLHDALTPLHPELLVFFGKKDGKKRMFTLARSDQAPPESNEVLTQAQFERLSVMQQSLYAARLPGLRAAKEKSKTEGPSLSVLGTQRVLVSPDGVLGAVTPEWIVFEGPLQYRCPESPLRSIELASAAPMPRQLARFDEAETKPAQLPLWRVAEAKEACARGEDELPSVPVSATIRCGGAEPVVIPVQVPLSLVCSPPSPETSRRWDGLRVQNPRLLLGSDGATRVDVWWQQLRPVPTKVSLVEVDASGAVKKRHLSLPIAPVGEKTERVLKLDASTAREVRLALELTFFDGSVGVSTAVPVRVATQATYDAEARALEDLSATFNAVMARMEKVIAKPCDDPRKTVEWLRQQEEVDFASVDDGHTVTVSVRRTPVVIDCPP